MDKYEIGMELKRIRMSLNIGQDTVAEFLGTTPQKISSFETGRTRVDLETFILLCSLYGISADTFFSINGANALSADEQALVQTYRSLDDDGKKALSTYADFLASSSAGSDSGSQQQVG